MNRRNFMRAILGAAATTALPSEVWPFRKIFLPAAPQVIYPPWEGLHFDAEGTYLAAIRFIPRIEGSEAKFLYEEFKKKFRRGMFE